ncbi:hypothetical protein, partial [Rhodovulum kholense]|uniref:hypothetical protein n=1 Tax=Rhodovulum kholense TaxID=453584 RepID=UPI001C00A14C
MVDRILARRVADPAIFIDGPGTAVDRGGVCFSLRRLCRQLPFNACSKGRLTTREGRDPLGNFRRRRSGCAPIEPSGKQGAAGRGARDRNPPVAHP